MGLSNTQYNAIMRDYQKQQSYNHQVMEERIQEVYAKIPAFADLDAQIASVSTACARKMLLMEETSSAAALRQKIDALSAKKQQLLQAAGFPENYLEPVYRCPSCQDTGYIGSEKCHCFRQASIDLLYSQSNLREVLGCETFDTFSLDYYSEQITDPVTGQSARAIARRAYEECLSFAKNFRPGIGNLFLYGETGLGKTFLSHCIAQELLSNTWSVIYFTSYRLFETFADTAFGRVSREEQTELQQHIFDCDFLIIDDLGTELVNSFVSSELFHILNERMLRKKSTLISTNLPLQTFADTYSERVFSRITSNYTMLKLIGQDIRIQKKISGQRG